MNEQEFLPIGTVVLLKGGTKKVMITGFCVVPNDNKNKLYDYSACLYPEGVINSSDVCLFNKEQIQDICFKGYINEEEEEFKKELDDTLKNIQFDSDHNIVQDNLSNSDIINDNITNTQTFSINDNIFG